MATLSGTHDLVRYNAVARLFHAVIAALVLFNILTGIFGERRVFVTALCSFSLGAILGGTAPPVAVSPVAAVDYDTRGVFTVTLQNGQVWRQVNGEDLQGGQRYQGEADDSGGKDGGDVAREIPLRGRARSRV